MIFGVEVSAIDCEDPFLAEFAKVLVGSCFDTHLIGRGGQTRERNIVLHPSFVLLLSVFRVTDGDRRIFIYINKFTFK